MKKDIFSSTLRRFVLYIIIIVLLFSSIIIFQTAYSIYDRQKITVENVYPMIKNEVISRQTSLYSSYSSTAFNAQEYLYESIEKLSTISGMMILIFDEDGRVISYAPKNINLDEELENEETVPLFYLPEDSNYKSLFDIKKDLVEGRKLYNKIIGESDSIGRSFVFIDEYNTSRTNPDVTKKIAISINIYKDSEKQILMSNILLLILPLLTFMIVSILIIGIFAKSVSKPLNEFLGLARSVSQGDLKVRIEYKDDKTEIGELSKTFNNMMDKLEMTENQRAEFASNVAHELRTPMTAIGGFIEGILDGTIPKEKNEI
nr:HAMP domain-containing protein [Clostridia bacterium]